MKHLFTKLLLVLAIVFGVSVAQAADFYLRGGANIMGEDAEFGWQAASSAKLTTDASGSVYFWANGNFKISYKTGEDWDAFNGGCFVINASDNSVNFPENPAEDGDSNLGSGKKYVKLHYNGGDLAQSASYSVAVQDSPFESVGTASYFENGSTIYFHPTSNFAGGASFKAKFNNNSEVFCSKLGDTGYWSFTVPADGLTSVKIQRGADSNTGVSGGTWWDNYTQEMKCEAGMNLIYMDNAPGTADEWRAASCIWKVYEAPAPAAYTYSAYNNFADGNNWEDLMFVEKNGVLTVEATFDGGLQVRRAFGIKVLDNGSQKGWYSAKIGEEILSLLNKETELSLYTTDIKNIQVPAGTTYCKIELTLDGTTPVSIKVTLEGERTPDLWLGSGSSAGSDRTKLGITAGEYDVYLWNTTTMGDSFRFYSAASGGNWIGPESNENVTIPGNGESQHKTAGNGNFYKFQTPGIYHIRVLSYDGDCGVVFKVMREEVVFDGDIPKNLSMQIWKNTQAELDPYGTVEMKYDEATKKFTGNVPAEWYGSTFWRTIRLTEKDENGKWISSFGPSQELTGAAKNLYLSESNRKHNLVRYSGNTVLGNFESNFHSYNNNTWCGDVTVVVDFSGSVPTVEVFPCYYFIGDQNKWFSKEFDGGAKGLNKDVRDANKAGWEFSPELDEDGNPTGWYYRHTDRLAGQFQIFDGNNWDTDNTYSHVVKITKDGGIFEDHSYFESYLSTPLVIGGDDNEVRHGEGQNFNLPCNAIENCYIRFNPLEKKLQVSGDMVDYYIFYGRDGDDDRTTPLRAHINSDKPNSNNYFLPFNNVTSYNGNTFYAQNVKLDNGSYDYDHMNYTVGDNYDANGKIMVQLEFDENGKYVGGDEAFYALFPYAADVREAYANGTLPNGMSLKNQKVWYTKVPNGFANPAGTHFAVAFRNSADKASYRDTEMKYPLWTPLGTRHLYFFDGIHMHVSNTSWSDLCDTEIAYRVYTYDINYNNVVVDYSKRDESDPNSLYMLYVKASAGSRPANTTDDDNDAWITLSSDHLACDMWKSGEGRSSCSCPFIEGKGEIHDWRVADTDPDVTTSVSRNEIPAGLAAARVQFRIKISPKGSAARAAGSNFEPYTVYFPEAPTIGQKDDEVRLQGVDHYMVMDNESGVWTAIKNVLEDNGFNFNEDNSTPIYYNLQGVRVEKPGKGLHIVVRGNKSEKILF